MPKRAHTILAVDDEPEIVELYRKLFAGETEPVFDILSVGAESEESPIECRGYTEPARLLEDYRREVQKGIHYPLCIVDMKMSTPDEGLVTAVELRKIDADIDIVFCTAVSHIAPEDVREKLQQRVFFVGKPFNNEEFTLMIRSLVDYWQSRQDLRRQTAFLGRLLESVPDLIFVKDAEGTYLRCNQAFARFAKRRPEEIIGGTDEGFLPEDKCLTYVEQDRRVLASGNPATFREWVEHPDGYRCLLETVKSPVFSPAGECIGLIGVGRDITERVSNA